MNRDTLGATLPLSRWVPRYILRKQITSLQARVVHIVLRYALERLVELDAKQKGELYGYHLKTSNNG